MADVHSPQIRSYNMIRTCSSDIKPEMLLRRCLFIRGFHYRIFDKKLAGRIKFMPEINFN
jgi:DNA mismatch endonuclease (patch repair protein)